MQQQSKIIGLGSFVPKNIFKNTDLEKMMNTSDEWIQQRTGIQERRWASKEQSTSELAYEASVKAIEDSGIDKKEIDCIIFATLSPDYDFPGSACLLQRRLELNGIAAYDIRQQCSGFIYGLEMVNAFIRIGQYKNILLVGSEIHSQGLDKSPSGRDVSVLFGDGAGAMIIQANNESTNSGIIGTEVHADGDFAEELCTLAPGNGHDHISRLHVGMLEEGLHYPKMNGKLVFTNAVRRMCEVLKSLTTKHQVQIEDIDLFVFHQANLRINQKVADMMGIDHNKVFNTIEKFGNTTAATIPLTLDEAKKAGVLKDGMLVASAAFGAGFTWGSALYRWR